MRSFEAAAPGEMTTAISFYFGGCLISGVEASVVYVNPRLRTNNHDQFERLLAQDLKKTFSRSVIEYKSHDSIQN
ncbi:hypothetical protein T265_05929 [Opisthorchis viverrini]|uniref:Uncharacterized protein n=1 Tax=Opisthorchis viverrini TaxID=6198 RepID=A0A074ZIX9_OPIVI|nr:hypothetical protein T265_05929 [Opisthorchis viverrini]KER26951.1 hypothetical protein T265_05929 [Opisthorchis viverrini]